MRAIAQQARKTAGDVPDVAGGDTRDGLAGALAVTVVGAGARAGASRGAGQPIGLVVAEAVVDAPARPGLQVAVGIDGVGDGTRGQDGVGVVVGVVSLRQVARPVAASVDDGARILAVEHAVGLR